VTHAHQAHEDQQKKKAKGGESLRAYFRDPVEQGTILRIRISGKRQSPYSDSNRYGRGPCRAFLPSGRPGRNCSKVQRKGEKGAMGGSMEQPRKRNLGPLWMRNQKSTREKKPRSTSGLVEGRWPKTGGAPVRFVKKRGSSRRRKSPEHFEREAD